MKNDNLLSYKGYDGSVEYSAKDNCLHGSILGITSLITYEGDSVSELKSNFEKAVDDYLYIFKGSSVVPEKPFNGVINLKLREGYHRLSLFRQTF